MSNLVSGIAEYTKQQAANTEEITHGVEQIASVVQSNASTAEVSAAASEELSTSPAREASTAAFNAKILVWKAISSIVLTILLISVELSLIFWMTSVRFFILSLLSRRPSFTE